MCIENTMLGCTNNIKPMKIIPEIDVLISCSSWLRERGALPFQFSVATGQGINMNEDQRRLKAHLINNGISESLMHFVPDGPDIIAMSREEYWQIECKGAGHGKSSTQRNNFDRALSSVVSYFSDSAPKMPKELKAFEKATPTLGLALPATKTYMALLEKRVRPPLRQRLNLWILLHIPSSKSIWAVSPNEDYPEKQQLELLISNSSHSINNSSTQHLSPQLRHGDSISPKRIYHRPAPAKTTTGVRTNSGANLNREWNVGARHALYHKDGKWYNRLERFPGAYFDPDGYILFKTEQEYINHPSIKIGEKVNIYGGISSLPGYKRMK